MGKEEKLMIVSFGLCSRVESCVVLSFTKGIYDDLIYVVLTPTSPCPVSELESFESG